MKEWKERCWAQVDLGAIRRNYRRLRSLLAPDVKYLAVVKADAYGHGAVPVARALEEEGADWFGVATLEEGETLRSAGIRCPILIFGYTPPHQADRLAAGELTQGIFSLEYAAALEEAAAHWGKQVDCHLMVDSGMSRLGLRPQDAGALEEAEKIFAMPHLNCTGAFTHFAVADELSGDSLDFTREQFRRFQEFCGALRERGTDPGLLHCSNSAAGVLYPEMQLGMCRFGIVSYGLLPSDDFLGRLELEPAISFKAAVAMVKTVEDGAAVSYGRIYTAQGARRIATVAAGYADGYPRVLGNRGRILIRGKFAPVVGRVCMDQMMVDVTHIPQVQMGDTVTLAGRDGSEILSWDELARESDTISYERICNVAGRVPRVYVDEEKA